MMADGGKSEDDCQLKYAVRPPSFWLVEERVLEAAKHVRSNIAPKHEARERTRRSGRMLRNRSKWRLCGDDGYAFVVVRGIVICTRIQAHPDGRSVVAG